MYIIKVFIITIKIIGYERLPLKVEKPGLNDRV